MARASSKLNQLQTKHLKQHNSPYTLLGKNISPPKVCLKMTFHFPRLGYVSSLEGTLIGSISTSGSIMVNPYPQAAQLPGVTSALRVTLCHGQSFRVFCGAHKSSPNKNPQGIPVFLFLSLFSLVFWKFFLGSNVKVLLEGFGLCGWWSCCFGCFSMGFLCPFLFGLGGYRAIGVFRMIGDWIPLQVLYKDQLQLEHWKSYLLVPIAIILASSHSSLGMQVLLAIFIPTSGR